MQVSVDSRVRALKHLHGVLAARAESLEQRANEIHEQTRAAPTASLDKTLQLAMDLRSKAAVDMRPQSGAVDESASNADTELALRCEIEKYEALGSAEEAGMQRELRERRVKVIRTIHSSGGSVDARFEH